MRARSGARPRARQVHRGGAAAVLVRALYKLEAVAVWVADKEDAGAAAHGVGLALELHPAGGLQLLGQGVEVLDGEGDVAVAGAEPVRLLLARVVGDTRPRPRAPV